MGQTNAPTPGEPADLAKEFFRETYGEPAEFKGSPKEQWLSWLGVATLAFTWLEKKRAPPDPRDAVIRELAGEIERLANEMAALAFLTFDSNVRSHATEGAASARSLLSRLGLGLGSETGR